MFKKCYAGRFLCPLIMFVLAAAIALSSTSCTKLDEIASQVQGNKEPTVVIATITIYSLSKRVGDDLDTLAGRLASSGNKYTPTERDMLGQSLAQFKTAHKAFNASLGKTSNGKQRIRNMLQFYSAYALARKAYIDARPIIKAPDAQLRGIDDRLKTVDKAMQVVYRKFNLGMNTDATEATKLFLLVLDKILQAA